MEEKKLKNDMKAVQAKPSLELTEVRASLRFLRMSPRKVRLITNFVRGMGVIEALNQLRVLQKDAKDPIIKVLESAIANAKHNFNIEKESLFIKTFIVNQGPTLKRWKPKAYGRAGMIRKRTCHVELTLGSTVASAAKDKKSAVSEKEELKIMSPEEIKKESKFDKGEEGGEGRKKTKAKGFTKRLFSRKTG